MGFEKRGKCSSAFISPRKQIAVPSHQREILPLVGQKSLGPVERCYECVPDLPSWIGGKAVLEASNARRSHFRKTR
jgi:hypothetical protein